jgi:hypothetical protein
VTTLTGQQRTLQSTVDLVASPKTGPTAQVFSTDGATTLTNTVTTSVVSPTGSQSVTEGTTADPAATYVGLNGGTPMFAIVNPRLPSHPAVLDNPLEAPPIPGSTPQGFNTNGTIRQGTLGAL